MALRVCNQGEAILLALMLSIDYDLKLFTDNRTPAEADTEASFTEASGGGYADKTLTGGSWTVTPGTPTTATYADQTFTFSGSPGTIYGYYVTRNSDGKLIWAERFSDGPYSPGNGDEIVVTPRITAQDTLD